MEKEIKIKTSDNHIIYGVLNTPNKKTEKLIIFVHGITGHKNEHIFYNAKNFFTKYGYATFRFDLYSEEKKGRSLTGVGISTHAKDINTVMDFFSKKYKKIYGVGHSLGAPSILFSETDNLEGVVFWDAADCSTKLDKLGKFNKKLGMYILDWGNVYLLSKKMVDEWNNFSPKREIKSLRRPFKIITAECGAHKAGKLYYTHANKPKSISTIKKAGHNFDEEGTEKKLFEETLSWFKKY